MSKLARTLCALALLSACRPSPERPRNLVLVVVDTLRQDRVHAYGESRAQTPFLDALAHAGCLADGRAPSSWTRPSTATIMSGLHPLEHQVISANDLVPESSPWLASILSRAGFKTVAVIGNTIASKKWGMGRGFDRFDNLNRELHRKPRASELNQRVEKLLPALSPPYFLYVHYMDPHHPYDPGVAWDGGPVAESLRRHAPITEAMLLDPPGRPPADLVAMASELYDGEVRQADEGVRELLAILERSGLLAETAVVVTADHGEEFLEHGGVGHGRTLYEEVLRVPLLFHAPGVVAEGGRLGAFPLEDLAPTLIDLLALRGPGEEPGQAKMSGRSRLGEVLTGRERAPASIALAHLDFGESLGLALWSERKKLLLGAQPHRKELFDLKADPGERVNRFGGDRAAAALSQELAVEFNRRSRAALDRRSTGESEIVDQLRALGYLGAANMPHAERRFPERIAPADARPGGLRGWEGANAAACVERAGPTRAQELRGWERAERKGEGELSIFVARPSGKAAEISISGHAEIPLSVSWRLDGRPGGEGKAAPGLFEVRQDLALAPGRGPVLIEIVLTGSSPVSTTGGTTRARGAGGASGAAIRQALRLDSICLKGR